MPPCTPTQVDLADVVGQLDVELAPGQDPLLQRARVIACYSEYSFSVVSPSEDYRLASKWAKLERELSMEALDSDDVDYQREAWQHDCSF